MRKMTIVQNNGLRKHNLSGSVSGLREILAVLCTFLTYLNSDRGLRFMARTIGSEKRA